MNEILERNASEEKKKSELENLELFFLQKLKQTFDKEYKAVSELKELQNTTDKAEFD